MVHLLTRTSQIVSDIVIAYFCPAADWNGFASSPWTEVLSRGGSWLHNMDATLGPFNHQTVDGMTMDLFSFCVSLGLKIAYRQQHSIKPAVATTGQMAD